MEMLVTRRSKRSTAGNRMEAALAEMGMDDLNKDMDDDNDFVNDKVEEDVFGSDFESTDEEAEKQAEEVGETEVVDEERRIKRAARTRLQKATAAAHAKHKSTFNPDIQISTSTRPKPKPKANQRVSLGVTLDVETGEVAQTAKRGLAGKKRMSQRKHTVLNTSATVTRLRQSEAKKASQPKKAKVEYKRYTQAELIALALDTEEGNIVEHRDYLKNEAEKRKRARVVRTAVAGPLLRWTSRKEEVKIAVPPPPPPPPQPAPVVPQAPIPSIYRSIYGPPGSLFTPTTYSYAGGATMISTIASTSAPQGQSSTTPATASQTTTATFSPYQHYLDPALSAFPMWPPPQPPYYPSTTASPTTVPQQALPQQQNNIPTSSGLSPAPPQTTNPASLPPREPEFRLEAVTKNYVVHELAQEKGTPKPTWAETMQAMFGDHVKWDEVKVFVGKGRPLSRPRQTCPITGRQAHYLDPRTGVPYADSYAYKVLTGLLRHEYVWNPSLGCYLDHGEPPPAVLEKEKLIADVSGEDNAMSVDS
ncbi:YL1 nuclear protein-domain-containing protein [Flammula alnicola]|nr:YL1 nuclear protein-domain-containing protein [Flammula alnicola]